MNAFAICVVAAAARAANPWEGFQAGDVWKGAMTSCRQGRARTPRYITIELRVLDGVDEGVGDNDVVVQFFSHFQQDVSYKLAGKYDPVKRSLRLDDIKGTCEACAAKGWKPCDSIASLSADHATLSGVALCEGHGACDPGGGEFVLRHDRAELMVEGAGDARVNGRYSTKGAAVWLPAERQGRTRNERSNKVKIYDGAPVFVQVCTTGEECDPYALVHAVFGQFGHWALVKASSLGSSEGEVLYSALSEDVYPPEVGWRPVDVASGPAPAIRTVVHSLYTALAGHQRLRAGVKRCCVSSTRVEGRLFPLRASS